MCASILFCKAPALNIVHVNTVQVVVSELARECTLMIGPFAAITIIDGLSIWMIIQAFQCASSLQCTIYRTTTCHLFRTNELVRCPMGQKDYFISLGLTRNTASHCSLFNILFKAKYALRLPVSEPFMIYDASKIAISAQTWAPLTLTAARPPIGSSSANDITPFVGNFYALFHSVNIDLLIFVAHYRQEWTNV